MDHPKIVPQKQANRHRPEEGVFGDCHRTCIAMILGLERDEVPHFLHDDPGADVFRQRVGEWLGARGKFELFMIWDGTTPLEDVLRTVDHLNPGVPFILGGESRTGVNHSVVCQHGEIVGDPSLTDAGIVAPTQPDGHWWVTFIVGRPDGR